MDQPTHEVEFDPARTVVAKPGNATYRGKVTAHPDGSVEVVPDPDAENFPHRLDAVEVAWYDDRVKVTIKKGAPAVLTQSYLTGRNQDVILEIKPAEVTPTRLHVRGLTSPEFNNVGTPDLRQAWLPYWEAVRDGRREPNPGGSVEEATTQAEAIEREIEAREQAGFAGPDRHAAWPR